MSFPAILAFEDGSVFQGEGFGKEKYDNGEIVFNTSMSGYQEIITDPSYKKQIITFTHPHIGNTGINNDDNESKKIHASGIVVRNYCEKPSNWRSLMSLNDFLIKNDVIGISKLDTRSITQLLREKGSLNCCIAALSKITKIIRDYRCEKKHPTSRGFRVLRFRLSHFRISRFRLSRFRVAFESLWPQQRPCIQIVTTRGMWRMPLESKT